MNEVTAPLFQPTHDILARRADAAEDGGLSNVDHYRPDDRPAMGYSKATVR